MGKLTISLLHFHEQGTDSLPDGVHRSPVLSSRPYFGAKHSTACHLSIYLMCVSADNELDANIAEMHADRTQILEREESL